MTKSKAAKVLFLYTELADYFLVSARVLSEMEDTEVHVVHWPVNPEAPFQFNFPPRVTFYERKSMNRADLFALADRIQPDVIISSGWVDKDYMAVCSRYTGKVPTVVLSDNPWEASWRQRLASVVSPVYIRKVFSHIWIPGIPQMRFAKALGFPDDQIMLRYYSADVEAFDRQYQEHRDEKSTRFPHRFLYVGRYVAHKGILDLWQAFVAAREATSSDWELWCLGTGPLADQAVEHEAIRHFGFVQPADLGTYIRQTGVMVLPSHFEPWGVVVHEFAAAGFPMVCSRQVGSARELLVSGHNGFGFAAGDTTQLQHALEQVMRCSDDRLLAMGQHSRELARSITPEIWARTILAIC